MRKLIEGDIAGRVVVCELGDLGITLAASSCGASGAVGAEASGGWMAEHILVDCNPASVP